MENNTYLANLRVLVFLFIDFTIFHVALKVSSLAFPAYAFPTAHFTLDVLLFSLFWSILTNIFDISKNNGLWGISFKSTLINLCYLLSTHCLVFCASLSIVKLHSLSLIYLGNLYVITLLLLMICRGIYFYVIKQQSWIKRPKNKFLIVGASSAVTPFYKYIISNKHLDGEEFVGFFDDNPTESPYRSLIVGSISDLKTYCLREGINKIYFALPLHAKELLNDISQFADEHYIYFRIIPDLNTLLKKEVYLQYYDEIPVITIRKEPLEIVFNRIIKRTFDILFSLFVILFIFPWVLPIIILSIKLNSEGPVFFKQMRAGIKKQPFLCYKFRTMYTNNQTHIQATKNDPRVTKVGRFLRKTSLDELPQFFNVLFGDMSVVGPRPYIFKQVEEYSKMIEEYKVRHFVPPGITGYAQVNGYRGEVAHINSMEKRVRYDVLYVENWSLFLDLRIIFLTVKNIFKGEENAY